MPNGRFRSSQIARAIAITILITGFAECSSKASKTEIAAAVQKLLATKGAPTGTYDNYPGADSGDYERCKSADVKEYGVRVEIKDVTVLEVEEPWLDPSGPPYYRHYQAKVWIEGVCLEAGKRIPFRGTAEVSYSPKNHSNVWWWP